MIPNNYKRFDLDNILYLIFILQMFNNYYIITILVNIFFHKIVSQNYILWSSMFEINSFQNIVLIKNKIKNNFKSLLQIFFIHTPTYRYYIKYY